MTFALGSADHRSWLADQRRSLASFAAGSPAPGGFAWLDPAGTPDPARPVATWITCRMTHVFALADGLGEHPGADLVDHGVAALRSGPLHDAEHGGWFTDTGDPVKDGYAHAFVVLAGAGAAAAGRPGGEALLAEALEVIDTRFWDEDAGLARESWDPAWTSTEDYRGANSNMHLVEAYLAAGDVTGDRVLHQRALRVAERIVHEFAAARDWRLPEHFTSAWAVDPEYNRDSPEHPFRPYGGTVGHWLEWARLLLHLEAALGADAPAWLLGDARALFDSAVTRGWSADGHPGFVYTLDWQDRPVVAARMHWVVCEAVLAAWALHARTGEAAYGDWYARFWEFADARHIDHDLGGWRHELTPDGRPAGGTWPGKPDTYHAYQAALFPVLGLAPAPAVAVRQR
ncbi:AGE family epimerase/isomerase [Actinokineospora guangxiensis]|uniref:AGE family epimerase/isomerase n=1 Tax=Actinokineospora guangxiensis TaxID=1490288 RepID=A0ABW0EPZ1_9PSEU